MQVYKFGGGTVKDANAIKKLKTIVEVCKEELVIVISAMSKITNELEKLSSHYFTQSKEKYILFENLKEYHINIILELFPDKHPVFSDINSTFTEIENLINNPPLNDYGIIYDKIVSYGEILSTKIISEYLNLKEIKNSWLDAKDLIITDENFGEARPCWDVCTRLITNKFDFNKHKVYITQGFIGATKKGVPTTLGREGSDFTASLIAYILNAEKVIIWKDVEGVLNADPSEFKKTVKLDKISYHEAIEMAFYGAKVIHPRTIKPLQNKKIPLYVKSFYKPEKPGTIIYEITETIKIPPVYIFKREQVLISILPRDFSFIAEDNMSEIFSLLAKYRIKVNLTQNSAISFSLCLTDDKKKISEFIEDLKKKFRVLYNDNLTLITIRHYTQNAINEQLKDKKVFIQQKSRKTARFVVS
ncbi:aspartate kinase [Bacteroidota bacterium]